MYDSHCHLNDPQFNKDLNEVIERAKNVGVSQILIPGYDLPSSIKAIELAKKYNFYAACGLHPHDAKRSVPTTLREFDNLIKNHPDIVAIGEIGLDFLKNYSPPEVQIKVLHEFLQLAATYNKPVILHVRNAYREIYDILKDYESDLPSIILHCFSGGPGEIASILEKENYYVSFSGSITYKNQNLVKAAKIVPESKILIETDAPYLTPSEQKGRNEPAFVLYVLKKISEIRKKTQEEMANIIYSNTLKALRISNSA
ncbi:MAG TPA: TatD family hydrolase [Candidatus Hydrothermia bacterium]|nr:TatD family hydrolase [Candidatus Hydrothermae bacterium]MDD3648667.1 TatD family hydrolase [Candidatus Hydrothermia bacterium]MDD5572248.1 TatD family hydrolase [Candidatus Hydrothermia bacterium]HOK22473.1 TatD family hydrolase [Candidatus Hydrothermia bacterium]HOL23180.1 TatD family hydrolase [Candidatus Hydrothermia bacterium]